MPPAISDTDSEAARFHLDLIRKASPSRRLTLALSLSRSVIALAKHRALQTGSVAEAHAADLRFVERSYGADIAAGVGERLRTTRS
jgi:hypothetical protein